MLDIEVGICRQPLLSVGIYQKWSYFVWGDGMSVEGGGGREGREVAWPDRQCREGSHQQPQSDTALWLHQSGNINLDSWGGNECERNSSDRLELIFPKRTWRWCVTFQPVSDKHNLHTSEAFTPPAMRLYLDPPPGLLCELGRQFNELKRGTWVPTAPIQCCDTRKS